MIEQINKILNERSQNIEWNDSPFNYYYHIWKGTVIVNGITYKAFCSISLLGGDSIEVIAKKILKTVKRSLAGQVYDRRL